MIPPSILPVDDPLRLLEDLAVSPMPGDDRIATAIECQMHERLMVIYISGLDDDISAALAMRAEVVEAARIRSEICEALR